MTSFQTATLPVRRPRSRTVEYANFSEPAVSKYQRPNSAACREWGWADRSNSVCESASVAGEQKHRASAAKLLQVVRAHCILTQLRFGVSPVGARLTEALPFPCMPGGHLISTWPNTSWLHIYSLMQREQYDLASIFTDTCCCARLRGGMSTSAQAHTKTVCSISTHKGT